MKKVVQFFLVWRIWLFIPLVLALLFLPYRKNSEFTNVWHYAQKYPVVESELVYPWANFDGVHYLGIASRGYVDEGRFLPLFPFVTRVVAEVLTPFSDPVPYGAVLFWSGMVVSTVSSIGAVVMLYRLFALDYSPKIAQKSILYLLAFPTAFILGALYTEGLFLFLSVTAFWFARKRRWLFSALTVLFLAVTRLTGLLVVVPILYELYVLELQAVKKITFKNIKPLVWFALTPLLLLAYIYYNHLTWGDPLYFVHAHGALGNSRAVSSLVFPLVTVYRYVQILVTVSPSVYEYWIAVIEIVSLVLSVVGLFFVWKQKQRGSYLLYTLVLVALPVLSGTLSGYPRYILPAFPFFLAQAIALQRRDRMAVVVLAVCFVLQAILLALFVRGYYVT